ncbi:MAG: serine hydrolase domain-containing protein [Bacteroidota bacterium]
MAPNQITNTIKKLVVLPSLLLLFTVLIFLSSSSERVVVEEVKEPIVVPKNPYLEDFIADYESYLKEKEERGLAPGFAVAIVKDTSVVYLKGFGVKQVYTQDSIDTNTVFRIASVSKGFAAALTGILDEDEMLSLNDKVAKHLDEFALIERSATDSLSLRHVLSHTTGLPYHAYTNLIEDEVSLDKMLNELSNVKLIGKAGEYYSYQNVAYSLIEPVIHEVTGRQYQDLLCEKIFNPLGMINASSSLEAMKNNTNVAQPHLYGGVGKWRKTKISEKYYNTAAAGGINASISDMSQWLLALLGNQPEVINNSVIDELFTPIIRTPIKRKYFGQWRKVKEAEYGLGWRILTYGDDTLAYHGGYANGFKAQIAVNKEENIGICVLANAPARFVNKTVPTFFDKYESYKDSIKYFDNSIMLF